MISVASGIALRHAQQRLEDVQGCLVIAERIVDESA